MADRFHLNRQLLWVGSHFMEHRFRAQKERARRAVPVGAERGVEGQRHVLSRPRQPAIPSFRDFT